MRVKDSWILLPALPFFAMVMRYAQNVPWMDDYEVVLQTVLDWRHSHSLTVLLNQHTDHRIVWARGIILAYYGLTGGVNFRSLILIGDLQLVVSAGIVAYFVKAYAGKYWQWLAAIFCLCLFDLNTYEAADWATVALQGYGVIMLFLLTLFFWHLGKIAPAVIFQVLCILSSGNGMIGAGVILGYLLLLRRWRHAAICGGIMAASVTGYFIGYVHHADPAATAFDPATILVYFIRMLGAHFDFGWSMLTGAGTLIAFKFAYLRRNSLNRSAWPLLAIVAFGLGSMGTVSLFRSCVKGAQFQTSRYLIYPEMVIGLTVVFLVARVKENRSRIIALSWITVFLLFIYYKNFGDKDKGALDTAGIAGFIRTHDRLAVRTYWHPDARKADSLAKMADSEGIYSINDNR